MAINTTGRSHNSLPYCILTVTKTKETMKNATQLVATGDHDLHQVFDALSREEKITRVMFYYDEEDILDVLGYNDGSMPEDEAEEFDEQMQGDGWRDFLHDQAINNGNFLSTIAFNAPLAQL